MPNPAMQDLIRQTSRLLQYEKEDWRETHGDQEGGHEVPEKTAGTACHPGNAIKMFQRIKIEGVRSVQSSLGIEESWVWTMFA